MEKVSGAIQEKAELHDVGVKRLLERAGFSEADVDFLKDLKDKKFSVFLHGSGTADELTEGSDIDFAIIGSFEDLPEDIKRMVDTVEGDDSVANIKIDYVSTSRIAENDRKISLHYVRDEFRKRQPNSERPYAYEFRSQEHIKKEGRNMYILSCVGKNEQISLFRFTCPQIECDGGVVNIIPQTGVFNIDGDKKVATASDGMEFSIEDIEKYSDKKPVSSELLVIGLEFDKMYTERPVFLEDKGVDEYVNLPLQRTYKEVKEWIVGGDECRVVDESLILLADNWDMRKNYEPSGKD